MDKLMISFWFCISLLWVVNAKYYGDELSKDDISPLQEHYDYQVPEIAKLEKSFQWKNGAPQEDQSWPDASALSNLGEVSGLATSHNEKVFVFHRGDTIWDESSFDEKNIYKHKDRSPIGNDTIVEIGIENGKIMKSWGKNMFYMPHGISVDPQGNVWLTDVALHQVFRFKRDQDDKPDLVLGERFVPGNDDKHFCKPTDVAIASSGIIYVSDGYCNSRILIYSPDGNLLGEIGLTEQMIIPHSLTLLENEDLICVADRENRRILCFTAGLNGERQAGKLVFNIQHSQLGRVFAIEHIDDVLLAVNGPDAQLNAQPQGISLDLATEQLINTWVPTSGSFQEPHDIAVSPDGLSFFVSEISLNAPKKVYKFIII